MLLQNMANVNYLQILPDGSSKTINQNTNIVKTELQPAALPKFKITYYRPRPTAPSRPTPRTNWPYFWLLYFLLLY